MSFLPLLLCHIYSLLKKSFANIDDLEKDELKQLKREEIVI